MRIRHAMSLFVNLPLREHQLCIANEHRYCGKDFPFHYHPEIEITYVFHSHGLRVVGDHFESYEKDDLVAIGPNIPHQWRKDAAFKRHGGEQERIIVVHIHGERLIGLVDAIRELHPIKPLLDEIRAGVRFSRQTALAVRPLMEKLVGEEGIASFTTLFELLDRLLRDDGRRMLSNRIANHTKRFPDANHPKSLWQPDDSADGRRIFKIVEYLLANHHRPVRASDLAGELNMSPSAFSHYFKKRTARTFRSYLNDIRLGHACKLLQQTEKPVAEICFECGFNSVSNFNRVFKGVHRRTPTDYRALIRGMVQ